MSVTFDEHGRPYIVIREKKEESLKGLAAQKAHVLAAKAVADVLKSSLGPKGMDKMLVSPDQDLTITNDGATIMDLMMVENQVAKLLVDLSQSQDDEVGDGTTGVVVLAGALLEHALPLLDKGIHPIRISNGYQDASLQATQILNDISDRLEYSEVNIDMLKHVAITALGSKIVSRVQDQLADICARAVLAVADLERSDVNLEMIKVIGEPGGTLEDTHLVQGIVLNKNFSHPQMVKEVKDARICVLTCPFEPPKMKTGHDIVIGNVEDYEALAAMEQKYFVDMIQRVKDSGCNLVICQWGFDDEANHLLLQNNLPAVRWVGGVEIEMIAIATGARIVPRFEELTADKLGTAGVVRESTIGTQNEQQVVIEQCSNSKAVTIVVQGGSKQVVEETKRCIHDALCVVRNIIRDNRIVYGGGAPEIAISLKVAKYADTVSSLEQHAVRAFASAVQAVPLALATNSGLNSIDVVSQLRVAQQEQNNQYLGVDCMNKGTNNMKEQQVFDTLVGKVQQIQLATQVVSMVLKISDVIKQGEQ